MSAAPDAQVLDLRYGRYEGARGGRAAAVLSLARWGALRSLGARRGWRAKLVPVALALLALGPAVVVLGVRALFAERTGIDLSEALPFSGYQAIIAVVILLFAAVTAPELLCPDRRDGTLSLYFSTAVGRGDYLLGRAIAGVAPMLLVTMVPMLLLYAGIVVFEEHPVAHLRDTWVDIPRILAAGAIPALYFGLVALAVASLTARRAYAVGGYLGLLVASTLISGLLQEAFPRVEGLDLLALSTLPIGLAAKLFPDARDDVPVPTAGWIAAYLAVVAIAALVLVVRYRRGEA